MTDQEEAELEDSDADASEDVEEAENADDAADDAESGIQDGDFVRIDYTARTEEGGQLVDTTDQSVAEDEGVDEQDQTFEPRVIVVGEGHLFPPVEEDIRGKEVGDEGEVVVPAAEAFGEHDPDEVRTVSADKIDEDDRYPGAHVHVDGDHGHLEAIIGGRARVDFNHPLAGEDLVYEYELLESVDDRVEQARGLVSAFLDLELEMWIDTDEVEEETLVEPDESEADDEDEDGEDAEPEFETEVVEKETLYIEATPQLTMNQQWMFSKQQIAQQVIDRIGVDRVIVQETIDGMGGGPMGGMMGGMGGGGAELEDALEDADVDAEELVEELDEE